MNIFNRIVMIILIPILVLVVTLVLAMPLNVWTEISRFFAQWAPSQEAMDLNNNLLVRIALLGVAAIFDLSMLLLFLYEIRRTPQRMIRVRRAAGGEVRLPVDTIAQRLAYHIDQIADVIEVQPRVGEKRGGVTLHLLVSTAPDVDVPAKADEILATAQLIVREKLGLTLASDPKIELRVAPYPQSPKVDPVRPPQAQAR